MSLAWAAGQKLTAAAMNARLPLYVDKSAGAQSVVSSTAYVDDTALQLTLLPNRTYDVRAQLSVTGAATGDIKLQWSLAADLTLVVKRAARGPTIGTTDVTGGSAAATTVGVNRASSAHTATTTNSYGLDGANASDIVEEATIATGSVGGLVKLQWAQRTSDAVATVVGTSSFLLATPVA
jgi:hypothetical protein